MLRVVGSGTTVVDSGTGADGSNSKTPRPVVKPIASAMTLIEIACDPEPKLKVPDDHFGLGHPKGSSPQLKPPGIGVGVVLTPARKAPLS